MKIDLNSMSRKELEKLKTNIDVALDRLTAKDRKAALAAAKKAVAQHGFSLEEVVDAAAAPKTRKAKPAAKKAGAPKYKDPADPAKTWTGKGRQPDWFKTALARGMTPDDLQI